MEPLGELLIIARCLTEPDYIIALIVGMLAVSRRIAAGAVDAYCARV